MKNLFFFSLLAVALHPGGARADDPDTSCKAGEMIADGDVTPDGLDAYLKKNAAKFSDVGDVVCCLPETYRKRVAIVHSSASAQSSDADNPRMLMFACYPGVDPTCEKRGSVLKSVVSINGGAEGLSQKDSIEMFTNRPRYEEPTSVFRQEHPAIQMHDLVVKDGKHELSEPNPQLCMSCHGSQPSTIGGPKPLMESDERWARMSSGVFSDCWNNGGAEINYLQKLQSRAEQAVKKNPRFRCLSPGSARKNIQLLDKRLAEINDIRMGRMLRRSPDFDTFKYAMAANVLRCGNMTDMIPPEAVRYLAKSKSMIDEIAKARDLQAVCERKGTEITAANKEIEQRQEEAVKDDGAGGSYGFLLQQGRFCSSGKNDAAEADNVKRVCKAFAANGKSPSRQLFDRYALDTMVRSSTDHDQVEGNATVWWRVLLDGRDLDAVQYQMQVRTDTFGGRGGGPLILGEWKKDKDLQNALKYAVDNKLLALTPTGGTLEGTQEVSGTHTDSICGELQFQSQKAIREWVKKQPRLAGSDESGRDEHADPKDGVRAQ
jgi:hypothetical protein